MARASRLILEWLLERVNTRFLSTATPAWPRAVLIITTKLPFVAAITRRRCRGKTPSILSGQKEKDEGTEKDEEETRGCERKRAEQEKDSIGDSWKDMSFRRLEDR